MTKEIYLIGYGINYSTDRAICVDGYLEQANKIFSVEPDISHITQHMTSNKPIHNLFSLYETSRIREEVYVEICEEIYASLEVDSKIALLVEGSPFFLNRVSGLVEARARKDDDITLYCVDGISSLSAITHQLDVPMAGFSTVTYLADEFCKLSPSLPEESILFLFQPGNVGNDKVAINSISELSALTLKGKLLEHYSPNDKWFLVNLGKSPDQPTKIIWNTIENIDKFVNYLHSGTLLVSKEWWPAVLDGVPSTQVEGILE